MTLSITQSILGWGFSVEESGRQTYESKLHYKTEEEAIYDAGTWLRWYARNRMAA
jgi:hypothetical protein